MIITRNKASVVTELVSRNNYWNTFVNSSIADTDILPDWKKI